MQEDWKKLNTLRSEEYLQVKINTYPNKHTAELFDLKKQEGHFEVPDLKTAALIVAYEDLYNKISKVYWHRKRDRDSKVTSTTGFRHRSHDLAQLLRKRFEAWEIEDKLHSPLDIRIVVDDYDSKLSDMAQNFFVELEKEL